MKKKLSVLICAILAIVCLAGCGVSTKIVINKNGSGTMKVTVSLEAEVFDSLGADTASLESAGYKKVEKNGKKYYEYSESQKFEPNSTFDSKELNAKYILSKSEEFQESMEGMLNTNAGQAEGLGMSEKEYEEMMEQVELTLSVKLPYKVVKSNGKIGKDHKTVTWDLKKVKDTIYAFTSEYSDTKAPVIKGIKNNGSYESGVKVQYSDNTVIKSAQLDGKAMKSGSKITKKGKHRLVVTDIFGNKTSVSFTVK